MDKEQLRSGSQVSAEAKPVRTPLEHVTAQLNKFLEKNYTHRYDGKESTWNRICINQLNHRIAGWVGKLMGLTVKEFDLSNTEEQTKLFALMGYANRSPRMSLMNLLKPEGTTAYLISKRGAKILRIGKWIDKQFVGVETTYHE